ncbi:unnamed protein product [Camellia sinensis]
MGNMQYLMLPTCYVGFITSAMSPSTVAERKRELFKLLKDKEVPRIVLFGESGVGKTWTAREMSLLAKNKGVIDIALWVFLNRQHDRASLCDSMAHQLSLLSTTREAEVEDKNEESENPRDLQHQIEATVAGKKLLLVLDDEGNKMSAQEIMSELETLLNVNLQNHKILITKRINRINSQEIIGSKIEVKPLSKDESLSLLQKHVRTGVYEVPGIRALAGALFEKTENLTKNFPAAIVLLAKAFNYFAQQDNGLQKLKRSLEEASGNDIYNITHLLRSGYDLLPNSVLIDCFCSGSHFFRDCRRIHYNELIAYWMMEGYFGQINCMEEAYERGHQVLMELIDCQILKIVEADCVTMEGLALNLDDIVMERAITNFDDCYRCGFGGTASLGLANVFGYGNWQGLGRITQKDGGMKTLQSRKQGQKFSTLLLDGNFLSREFPRSFFQSNQELQVLALFNPPLKTFSPSSSMMHELFILVLRGCSFMEKIDQVEFTLKFEKLTVLEISGPNSLTTIPDEFFKHLPQLRSLNLSALQIESLPSSLYELSELSWLILRDCSRLKTLKSLRNFKNLTVLDLSGATSLENIQDKTFSQNGKLQMLNFSKTKIKSIPLIKNLKYLTHLLLSGCPELVRLRGISSVASLQVLDLSNASQFNEFHDQSLENNVSLKILDLSGTILDHGNPRQLNSKNSPPEKSLLCIETLGVLEVLDLSKTHIRTLPSLSNHLNLRRLLLSSCAYLEELVDLNPLKKLEVLDLSGCIALTKLPDGIFDQMSCLWRLDLSETKIKYLPSLSNLSNLRHLLLKKCTELQPPLHLKSLSKLEELNLCGITSLLEIGADLLGNMSHLRILDLSETPLQQPPSMSNLKNIHQLYLRDCSSLEAVPGLEALTKLEVLDLSGTAVDHLPSLENFSNLRQLLLRDCPGLQEFLQLELLHLLRGTVKDLPKGISELTHLELLDLPNMRNTQGAGSNKLKEPNQYGWGISSLPAETVGDKNKPPVSVSSSQFLQFLENNPLLRNTIFRQFHISVHPIEERDRKGVVSFYRDDFMFRDIYFQTKQFSNFEEQGSLAIRGFRHSPKGINEVLSHADCVFLVDNAFQRWISDLGASNLQVLKGCWIERCREMECVFHEEEVEEMVKLESLEVLWVSNSVNLKGIYCGSWQSKTFQNLKHLYLDCCPKLSIVFSSSQLPINLQVLQIKFCDELEAVFEHASPKPELPHLNTLYLWELPKLKRIGCALPPPLTPKVWGCPNLADFKENVKLARNDKYLAIVNNSDLVVWLPQEATLCVECSTQAWVLEQTTAGSLPSQS